MFFAGAGYAITRWDGIGLLLATGCLALNWFGDSLDGTIARLRNRQRPRYGFYVDHMDRHSRRAVSTEGLRFPA